MAATPPPTSMRAHTPPTPRHGAQYDNYEPYSPRRSKRSTAHSNPYSSFNAHRSPQASTTHHPATTPPPTSAKKTRFARAPTQLSSPPSSPVSPMRTQRTPHKRAAIHKTPRKQPFTSSILPQITASHSDSDNAAHTHLQPFRLDPTSMLPTPSKTPKKRAVASTSSARILSFQPNHPNDVMPSPRRLKQPTRRAHHFDLYDDGTMARSNGAEIEIYTDANARVPVRDESNDNPFMGSRKTSTRPQRRSRTTVRSQSEVEREAKIEEAARRGEGVIYMFRGKKVLRRYVDGELHPDQLSAGSPTAASRTVDVESETSSPDQRTLTRQAGISAQRPLTRSRIQPRLLFPSEEQIRERAHAETADEEEALTDIEMGEAVEEQLESELQDEIETPKVDCSQHEGEALTTLPATRSARGKRSINHGTMNGEGLDEAATPAHDHVNGAEPMSLGSSIRSSFDDGEGVVRGRTKVSGKARVKASSPFDAWPRTKAGRKRRGTEAEVGEKDEEDGGAAVGKRTRSSANNA